jgi:NAD(P)-dependent dehydrogenase (short-subunit alcohol dehydrogenase family)
MGMLEGKVAIVTGAGRGLGREEALAMAKEGCNLIVNDINGADEVAKECEKFGIKAVANFDSVTDYKKTAEMIDQAISKFGKLDIVVNNAGIIRDRMIFNMTEKEFDDVVAVSLKGTFNLTRHAAVYFRKMGKEDANLKNFGRIINTASDSGLYGNVGQSNYGAAKSGLATFTLIVSRELSKYATVNCVVPSARTPMTTDETPKLVEWMNTKTQDGFDIFDPAHFAPLVVFLASDRARKINGEVFRAIGDKVWVYRGWRAVKMIENGGKPYTPELLAEQVKNELMKNLPSKMEGMATPDILFGK